MNKNIVIVAESGSDITPEVAEKYGIEIVPMHVSMGDKVRADGTFPVDEICEYYDTTGKLPKTSGSSPEDFNKVFDSIHEKYPEKHILYLAYSSSTTVSYASANIAAEGRDYITMLDTKHVSVGQYAVVTTVAEMLEKNQDIAIEEALAYAEKVCEKTRMCFIPNDLEYLKAGGRVSNVVFISGRLLKIHPRIEILDGKLIATKKHRGNLSKIAPQLVYDYAEENKLNRDKLWLIWAIGTTDAVKKAAYDAAVDCGFKEIEWVKTGCVITCHGGPGAFGVVGMAE